MLGAVRQALRTSAGARYADSERPPAAPASSNLSGETERASRRIRGPRHTTRFESDAQPTSRTNAALAGSALRQAPLIAAALIALGGGWLTLWTAQSFWNPVAFTALWTGAALIMWRLSRRGYPGLTRHIALALLSIPLWWWFEIINARAQNWEYVVDLEYTAVQHALFTSLAFSTVVPALSAAARLTERWLSPDEQAAVSPPARFGTRLILAGVSMQVAVLAFPTQLYPFVWIAPLLIFDGLVVRGGGRSLVRDLAAGRWREAAAIAAAGLICGLLWEFWNFWATPKWVYDVPLLGFGKLFEMPILGYGGYVPFAWSVAQFVRWADLLARRAARTRNRPAAAR